MHHTHGESRVRVPPEVQRILLAAIIPFFLATAAGLVLLWPRPTGGVDIPGERTERLDATVVAVDKNSCAEVPGAQGFNCAVIRARLDEGPDEGDEITFQAASGQGVRGLREGDGIIVGHAPQSPQELRYFFVDYQRDVPLVILGLIFAGMTVLLSRWKGLAALAGLAISLVVLVRFVIPAILGGSNPLLVATVGAAAIMLTTLYLAHGVSARTTTAILGTLTSLVLTGLLAIVFVETVRLTGISSEEASMLQVSAQQINLEGCCWAGS